jgi:hypothetical protein
MINSITTLLVFMASKLATAIKAKVTEVPTVSPGPDVWWDYAEDCLCMRLNAPVTESPTVEPSPVATPTTTSPTILSKPSFSEPVTDMKQTTIKATVTKSPNVLQKPSHQEAVPYTAAWYGEEYYRACRRQDREHRLQQKALLSASPKPSPKAVPVTASPKPEANASPKPSGELRISTTESPPMSSKPSSNSKPTTIEATLTKSPTVSLNPSPVGTHAIEATATELPTFSPTTDRVSFADQLISSVSYRPKTSEEEISLLYYSVEEMERFRKEYNRERKLQKEALLTVTLFWSQRAVSLNPSPVETPASEATVTELPTTSPITYRVSFADQLVSSVSYRPKTLEQEKSFLYYSFEEMEHFREEDDLEGKLQKEALLAVTLFWSQHAVSLNPSPVATPASEATVTESSTASPIMLSKPSSNSKPTTIEVTLTMGVSLNPSPEGTRPEGTPAIEATATELPTMSPITYRVSFADQLVSSISYRPKTSEEEISLLYYSVEETERFQKECNRERKLQKEALLTATNKPADAVTLQPVKVTNQPVSLSPLDIPRNKPVTMTKQPQKVKGFLVVGPLLFEEEDNEVALGVEADMEDGECAAVAAAIASPASPASDVFIVATVSLPTPLAHEPEAVLLVAPVVSARRRSPRLANNEKVDYRKFF